MPMFCSLLDSLIEGISNLFLCRPQKMRYLALYDMNRASQEKRAAFLARVAREMESF